MTNLFNVGCSEPSGGCTVSIRVFPESFEGLVNRLGLGNCNNV